MAALHWLATHAGSQLPLLPSHSCLHWSAHFANANISLNADKLAIGAQLNTHAAGSVWLFLVSHLVKQSLAATQLPVPDGAAQATIHFQEKHA